MKRISGIILFLVAFILTIIFAPIGMVFTIIRSILEWDYSAINRYYKDVALSLDQLGNVIMAGLLNNIFINDQTHLFGDVDETISSVIGKNKVNNSLSLCGKVLDWILNKIDKDHSINSIEQ